MAYRIRPMAQCDARAVEAIMLAAIREIGSRRYSAEQIEAWHGRATNFDVAARVDAGASVLVAADSDDVPVAYALIERDGHFDHLYCHPRHSGNGLGTRLIAAAEDLAAQLGVRRLFTEASELAAPVFERAGYAKLHRRDFDLDGVAIHNFAMEKQLG